MGNFWEGIDRNKYFNYSVNSIDGVIPSKFKIAFKACEFAEYFQMCDYESVGQNMDVIIELITKLHQRVDIYYKEFTKMEVQVQGKNKSSFVGNRKGRLCIAIENIIESIFHWATFSPISILFAAFIQFAFNNDSNAICHFIDEHRLSYGKLSRVRWDPRSGLYKDSVGEFAAKFVHLYGFEIGVRKRPLPMAQQWLQFQSMLCHFQMTLFDGYVAMKNGTEQRLEYLECWINFFIEFKSNLVNPLGQFASWQKSLQK